MHVRVPIESRVETRHRPDADAVLTRALLRAADGLGLTQRELAAVIGVSPASLSRLRDGRHVRVESKEGELALLFLRVYRSLDTLVGGDASKARAWLGAHNVHLGGVPARRLATVEGLVHVAEYLDAMRGTL